MVLDPDRSGGRYPVTPVPADDPLVVTLLGRIAFRRGSALVAVPGNRARSLLVALALRPGRTRSAAALIEDVWGDEPPRAPANALHTQISRLRSVLPDRALEAGPGGYRLALRPEQVDLTAVRELAGRARAQLAAGEVEAARRSVDRARALWSDEPGADLPAGPLADELSAAAAAQAEELDEVERETRVAAGDLDGAIAVARRQLRRRPFAEAVAHTLMRLLATAGRDSEALAVFVELRAALTMELGTDPGPAITELNTAILRGRYTSRETSSESESESESEIRSRSRSRSGSGVGLGSGAGVRMPSAVGVRAAPNALIGRADDLTELSRLLRVSRVTTVLGPGGAGKTRVAHELAASEAHSQPVVLVELASVRPGDATAEAVVDIESAAAAAMGLGEVGREPGLPTPGSRPDTRRRLRDALSARPMLLVLDNCEHLVEAAAAVVADLVGSCPQLTVLTTSRAPLAITAETVYPLGPLASDAAGSPATDLFRARAQAVRPSVRLDMEVVARLCRTLDGLPLAIELAAARVRTMSVEDIERRLDRRFALLRSGDRTSPERHRTLYAVIAWSWNLLAPDEQVTLRRMCRFPGGFTLAAAEAVAGGAADGEPAPVVGEPCSAGGDSVVAGGDIASVVGDSTAVVGDIAAAVEGLVGQSLLTVVEVDGAGLRYRMLETVREFGEQELIAADTGPGSEIDLVETRMACWARDFASWMAEDYGRGDELGPALTVAAELDNLVAVLRRAERAGDPATMYAVFPVAAMRWVMHGANLELMGWIPRMLAMAPPGSRGVYAELEMAGHAVIALHLAFMDGSLRHLALVRIRARRLLRDNIGLRPPFRFLGQLLTCPSDSLRLARLLARATRSPNRHTRSLALMARTNIWENMGRIHESSRDAEVAVPNLTETEVWSRAMLAQHRGSLAGQVARYGESVAFYEEAAELLHRIRAYEESLEVHSYLAASLAGSGEPARARRELDTALGFSGSGWTDPAVIDDPGIQRNHRLSTIAAVLAGIELVEGEIDIGLAHFRRALELVGWPLHETTPGPGLLLTGAAALAAHALYERGDVVARLLPELVELAQQRFGHVLDLPQLGGVACAVGSGLLVLGEQRAAGVELLALAPRVASRQDYPVLRWDRHRDLWRDRIGAGRLYTAVTAAGGLRRAAAAERIVALIREVGAHPSDPLARPAAG